MAHMKDLNQQMKIHAERMRLQSRGDWPSESETPRPGQRSVKFDNMSKVGSQRRPQNKDHNVRGQSGRPPSASNQHLKSKGAVTTPSKIPVRKHGTGMSASKGMSALEGKPLKQQASRSVVDKGSKPGRTADYSWHKGGRIQELRIRYIARKFFKLWVAACFGKIGPDQIRAHYRKQLLRRAWREWHELWWVNRREWRLQVRAQYHHRYCLTRKAWQAWVQYVVKQRIVNAKTSVADQHANSKLLRATFMAWKQYTSYRDVKKRNFGNAYRIADTRRMAQAWQQWRNQMQNIRDKEDMQQHALQYWAEGLVHKCWVKWKSRLTSIAEIKRKEQLAIETYHRSLLARCFYQGFMPYVLHRRDRKEDKGVASQFYLTRLRHDSFHHWHTLWFTRRSLALRGQQIDTMAQRARLRRVWIHWQFYIHLKHVEAEKIMQAERFNQRKLLVQGMHAFKTAVALQKLQDIRKEKADEMRYSMVLRWSWSTWLQGCEHKEELRLYVQSRKARNHYKRVLLSKVISGWVRYTRWRQHRQAEYLKADAHYISRLLPNCLHRIQLFAQIMREKRFNQEQALLFRRECLLGFCLARWHHSYQTSLDVRMMERMAIMHYDHNVAQRMLIIWKQRTKLQLQENAKEVMASDHYHEYLLKNAVQTWKAFTTESIQSQNAEYKAVRHHYVCLLKKGWQAWVQYVAHNKVKSNKLMKADVHYHHRVLQRTLDAWKVYNSGMKVVYKKVKEMEHQHNMVTLRWTFVRWNENARLQCEERRHLVLAEDHHRSCLFRKVVICWRQYAVLHAHKQSQKMERLVQIRTQLDRGKRQRAFKAWRSFKDASLLEHLAESRANSHYHRILLHKTLHKWIKYRQLEIKKTLLRQQCAWLHNTRITAKYFLVWRAQHHAAIGEQNKTTIALWQWSLVLQQKVLNGWLQYVIQQRHKKQRIAVAMEMRRQRLLRDGVGQWLRVATDMEARREKKAAQFYAQTAYRNYNLVWRCAHHWRQKTLANRGSKRSRGLPAASLMHKPSPGPGIVRIGTGSIAFQPIDPKLPSQPKPSSLVPSIAHRATLPVKKQFPTAEFVESSRNRAKPRKPEFLMESLQREGLWKSMSGQYSAISHPISPEVRAQTQSPASDDDDDNGIDESLPRSQPPPPPSPQPKLLVQSSQLKDPGRRRLYEVDEPPQGLPLDDAQFSGNEQLKDPGRRRLYEVDESPQSLPMVINAELSGNEQVNIDPGGRTITDVGSAPFLMPPSAFTAINTDWNVNAPHHTDDDHIRTNNTAPSDLQGHLALSRDNELSDSGPGAEMSSPDRGLPQSTEMSGTSRNYHLLSPNAFHSKGHVDSEEDDSDMSDHDEENDDQGSGGNEDIYKEIMELKNKLLHVQQAKQKLTSLKEQHKHLRSWLKELEGLQVSTGMHATEDEDVVSVRQEVAQMEIEIAELKSELDQRKPECVKILEKINVLAAQIQ